MRRTVRSLWGFPHGSVLKNPLASAGDESSDPQVGQILGEEMQATPVFSSGKSHGHGQKSLAGYCSWSCKDLDTAERLSAPRCAS